MTTNVRIDPATKYRSPWIEGYVSKTSVRPGETITIHVSTNPASPFMLEIYRLGLLPGARRTLDDEGRPVQGQRSSPTRPSAPSGCANARGPRARRSRSPPIGPAASTSAS